MDLKKVECKICNVFKDPTEFYSDTSRKNSLHPYCITCKRTGLNNFKKTPRGVVNSIYQSEKANSIKRNHPYPTYNLDELYEWVLNNKNFNMLYNNWVNSGYSKDLKPSVDRINSKYGYTFDNIRLVTWKDNLNFHIEDIEKSILQLDLDGNLIKKYKSINLAARENNLSPGHISRVINNIYTPNTIGGYIWLPLDRFTTKMLDKKLALIIDNRIMFYNDKTSKIELYKDSNALFTKFYNDETSCFYKKNKRSINHMVISNNYKNIWRYKDSLKYIGLNLTMEK